MGRLAEYRKLIAPIVINIIGFAAVYGYDLSFISEELTMGIVEAIALFFVWLLPNAPRKVA